MKSGFNSFYVKNSEKEIFYTPLYFRMKLVRFINKWRQFLRFLIRRKRPVLLAKLEITSNLEKAAAHFQKHGWAYVENIISEDFHKELLINFPKRHNLVSPNLLAKSYDSATYWVYGRDQDFSRFDPYNYYQAPVKFLNYLRSPEFADRITKFVGLGKEFACYSFTANRTYVGSEVIPHKDCVQDDPLANAIINIVFFINGTGGKNSGGLSLSKDSELKDMIVEPENLKNTCLIYDSLADFYHGFRPVARGKFRWAMNSQFCTKDYAEKSRK